MELAAQSGEFPLSTLAAVCSAMERPIRLMSPIEADAAIIKSVLFVAGNYGGQSDVSKSLLAECCDLCRTQFAGLAADEIITAFRLAAARQLPESPALYGGNLNAERLGAVLSSYLEYRRKIQAALERAKSDAALQAAQNRKDAWWKSEAGRMRLKELEDNRITKLLQSQELSVFSVTVRDYELLSERCLLELSADEKWALMEKADLWIETQRKEDRRSRYDRTTIAQSLAVIDWIKKQGVQQTNI